MFFLYGIKLSWIQLYMTIGMFYKIMQILSYLKTKEFQAYQP